MRFTKPITPGGSANYIWSYEKKRKLLASYLRLETFSNNNLFPKEIYGRVNLNVGAVDFDFLEFEIQHGHNIEALVAQILFGRQSDTSDHSDYCHDQVKEPINPLLKRLRSKNHLEESTEAIFHWTLMESVEKFWSLKTAANNLTPGSIFWLQLFISCIFFSCT